MSRLACFLPPLPEPWAILRLSCPAAPHARRHPHPCQHAPLCLLLPLPTPPCSRLSNNSLAGTLPEQWGTPGSFPKLSVLSLDRNNLTGGIPDIWGAEKAMTELQEL